MGKGQMNKSNPGVIFRRY